MYSDLISVIVGFRDREFERVLSFVESLDAQTSKNFELIFVDYGSQIEISNSIKNLINSRNYASYVFHDSRGKSWNRSHALNIGSKHSNGSYLYFTDIDLVFHYDYIAHLEIVKIPNTQLYTRVFLLPKNTFVDFSDLSKIERLKSKTELSHKSGKGILLIEKSIFLSIGGYDEFYRDWGIEDNDLFIRLTGKGIKENWTDHLSYPVFHIWHPQSTEIKFPEKWLDESAFYYIKNQSKIVRNPDGFGLVTNTDSRKIIEIIEQNNFDKEIIVEKAGLIATKTMYFRKIWAELNDENIHALKIYIPKLNLEEINFFQKLAKSLVKRILKTIKSPFDLVYFQQSDRTKYFLPQEDLKWYIRKLIIESELIDDYFIEEDDENMTVILYKN
jgi:glycosyltransferase involved in cell wall biosynthesis